jgi:hypothetical protein
MSARRVIARRSQGTVGKKPNHNAAPSAARCPATRQPKAATATVKTTSTSAASVFGRLARRDQHRARLRHAQKQQ